MNHLWLPIVCSFALIPTLAHAATNLVPNPGFDDGAAGWTPMPGFNASVGASPIDEHGKAEGGSLRLFDIAPSWQNYLMSECFPVHGGEDVVFGASTFGQGPPTSSHVVRAALFFSADASCVTYEPGQLYADLKNYRAASTWRPIQGYGKVPVGAQSARLALSLAPDESPSPEELVDNAFVYEGATCASTPSVVCLSGGRFRLDVWWQMAGGTAGHGNLRAFTAGSADSAYATFFSPTNVEAVIKVLDACSYNDRFWVFAAGLTDVWAKLRVTDTHTGETWLHENPLGEAFLPVQDVDAFATCP
jgi:hypothetical protein